MPGTTDADLRRALAPFDDALSDPKLWALGARPAPLDIACELCRAMEAGRFQRRGKTYVQTVYTAILSPADFARYEPNLRELTATLKDTLVWWAGQHGYAAPGELRVRVTPDDALRAGMLSIEAGLRAEEAAKLGRLRGEQGRP